MDHKLVFKANACSKYTKHDNATHDNSNLHKEFSIDDLVLLQGFQKDASTLSLLIRPLETASQYMGQQLGE